MIRFLTIAFHWVTLGAETFTVFLFVILSHTGATIVFLLGRTTAVIRRVVGTTSCALRRSWSKGRGKGGVLLLPRMELLLCSLVRTAGGPLLYLIRNHTWGFANSYVQLNSHQFSTKKPKWPQMTLEIVATRAKMRSSSSSPQCKWPVRWKWDKCHVVRIFFRFLKSR